MTFIWGLWDWQLIVTDRIFEAVCHFRWALFCLSLLIGRSTSPSLGHRLCLLIRNLDINLLLSWKAAKLVVRILLLMIMRSRFIRVEVTKGVERYTFTIHNAVINIWLLLLILLGFLDFLSLSSLILINWWFYPSLCHILALWLWHRMLLISRLITVSWFIVDWYC